MFHDSGFYLLVGFSQGLGFRAVYMLLCAFTYGAGRVSFRCKEQLALVQGWRGKIIWGLGLERPMGLWCTRFGLRV